MRDEVLDMMRSIFHSPVEDEEQRTESELLNNMPDAGHNTGMNADGETRVDNKSDGRFICRTPRTVIALTDALRHQWTYQTLKFVVYMHQISDGSHREWACPIMQSDLVKYIVRTSQIKANSCSMCHYTGKNRDAAQGYCTLHRAGIPCYGQRARNPQMEQVYSQDWRPRGFLS